MVVVYKLYIHTRDTRLHRMGGRAAGRSGRSFARAATMGIAGGRVHATRQSSGEERGGKVFVSPTLLSHTLRARSVPLPPSSSALFSSVPSM